MKPWVKYSFFTKMATFDKCGAREHINPSSKKYVEGQLKLFAKEHEHEQLQKPKTS
jgi:hypothetical protein